MKLRVAWIGKTKEPAYQALTNEYLKRISYFTTIDPQEFSNEVTLLKSISKQVPKPFLVLLDSRGKQFSSEELAAYLEDQQDRGLGQILFAIGPSDGFSEEAIALADLKLSFGKMTFAHELARVVLLEQLYRAFTIIKKHPYHLGHK
ncbi:MAG TPA: 23S rRNA (pseudouridine(1915)-N(3))-methyltransferase RlmH [Terriglobales bacterium]|nr:23S rRNA (pseudouridine(1915)-N(3))-methyltransferase RlmH [Terriglobales bacterium]